MGIYSSTCCFRSRPYKTCKTSDSKVEYSIVNIELLPQAQCINVMENKFHFLRNNGFDRILAKIVFSYILCRSDLDKTNYDEQEVILTDGNSYTIRIMWLCIMIMVFNATLNDISVISRSSVLLVDETGGPGENHRPIASHGQTLSQNVVSSTPLHERGLKSQLY